jgi:hypothetical protein
MDAETTTKYAIESKPCRSSDGQDPEWRPAFGTTEYDQLEDAEREWSRLDGLYGDDTYHRLVRVKRKVLKSA